MKRAQSCPSFKTLLGWARARQASSFAVLGIAMCFIIIEHETASAALFAVHSCNFWVLIHWGTLISAGFERLICKIVSAKIGASLFYSHVEWQLPLFQGLLRAGPLPFGWFLWFPRRACTHAPIWKRERKMLFWTPLHHGAMDFWQQVQVFISEICTTHPVAMNFC